jgi:8-oxo-dGTP diphosphatase
VDETRWVAASSAGKVLTRRADRRPLQALVTLHNQGFLDTRVLIIQRHGKAITRDAWVGGEATRPLTPIGFAQAAALVPVLAAYGVTRIVTSAWERCDATIRPYAQAADLTPKLSKWLTELEHKKTPAKVSGILADVLSAPASSVVATHRPVLPTVIDVLRAHIERLPADGLPATDPYLQPGESLVAHVAQVGGRPRIAAIERVTPVVF